MHALREKRNETKHLKKIYASIVDNIQGPVGKA